MSNEKKTRKTYTSNNVSPADFVIAWQQSKSSMECAELLGMSHSAVTSRANAYRKRGIPLQRFHRRDPLDVGALRDLAIHVLAGSNQKQQGDEE